MLLAAEMTTFDNSLSVIVARYRQPIPFRNLPSIIHTDSRSFR